MMSSTSAGDPGAPQIQQAAPQSAAPPPNRKLALEDIEKYFHLPIADAASLLGVCTSVLKRICRENGIIRWPYRKYLAGKTFDDIRKEAAREKSKIAASNTAKQTLDVPKMVPSAAAGFSAFGSQANNRAPGQQGVSMPGNTWQQQENRSFQFGVPNTVQSQTRHIPTYFDDFKYGFPADGLSHVSIKWWGTGSVESDEKINSEKPSVYDEERQDASNLESQSSRCMGTDEQTDAKVKDDSVRTDPAASLVSLRKRAVECGCKSFQFGISDVEPCMLGKRKRLLMFQIFRTSLPDQWNRSI